MKKSISSQRVESDVSTPEEALRHVAEMDAPTPHKSKILAENDPKTVKGYTSLGPGGPAHTGKPTATENRGEGGGRG